MSTVDGRPPPASYACGVGASWWNRRRTNSATAISSANSMSPVAQNSVSDTATG